MNADMPDHPVDMVEALRCRVAFLAAAARAVACLGPYDILPGPDAWHGLAEYTSELNSELARLSSRLTPS